MATQGKHSRPGRPRLGKYRLETTLPQACLEELMRREVLTGQHRSRIAAQVLIENLIGHGDTLSGCHRAMIVALPIKF